MYIVDHCHSVSDGGRERFGFPACITGHMTGGSASRCVHIQGDLHPGEVGQIPPAHRIQSISRVYTSYWNAFLSDQFCHACRLMQLTCKNASWQKKGDINLIEKVTFTFSGVMTFK